MSLVRQVERVFYWAVSGRILLYLLLSVGILCYERICPSCIGDISAMLPLLATALLLAVVHLFWFRFRGPGRVLKLTMVVADALMVSLLVHLTSGASSPFLFLFPVAMITACLLGGKETGTLSALMNTAGFALIFWLSQDGSRDLAQKIFLFSVNMGAFNLIALLTILLGRRLWQAEENLFEMHQSMHRLQEIQKHLINSMRSGLITLDNQGKIIYYNIAAIRILGEGIKNCYGAALSEIWPEAAPFLEDCTSSMTNDRHEISMDVDGKRMVLGISCFPIEDSADELVGYGLIFQDITEAKEQERRLQMVDRLVALGEMAAGLAHEIRNPLASIRGAAEFMVSKGGGDPNNRHLLEIIIKETDRLEDLTKSFLLYGRPEQKQQEMVDFLLLTQQVMELLLKRKGFRGVDLQNRIPEGLEAWADPQLMKQVFLNLIINAWQALPDQGGNIILSGRRIGDRIELKVIDNGKGIREEDLPSIFNPFFTTKPEGTGLGLSIVHRIVTQAGGELRVESSPGEGTVFTICLPANRQSPAPEIREEKIGAETEPVPA